MKAQDQARTIGIAALFVCFVGCGLLALVIAPMNRYVWKAREINKKICWKAATWL